MKRKRKNKAHEAATKNVRNIGEFFKTAPKSIITESNEEEEVQPLPNEPTSPDKHDISCRYNVTATECTIEYPKTSYKELYGQFMGHGHGDSMSYDMICHLLELGAFQPLSSPISNYYSEKSVGSICTPRKWLCWSSVDTYCLDCWLFQMPSEHTPWVSL